MLLFVRGLKPEKRDDLFLCYVSSYFRGTTLDSLEGFDLALGRSL